MVEWTKRKDTWINDKTNCNKDVYTTCYYHHLCSHCHNEDVLLKHMVMWAGRVTVLGAKNRAILSMKKSREIGCETRGNECVVYYMWDP